VRTLYGDKYGPRPGFYTSDDRLGWRPAPNLDHTFYGPDFKIHIRTDADGYRLGALGEVDYSRELVVLCGDSYAFGWGVSTDQTFASHLDQIFHDTVPGRFRVVNVGVGGYGILQNCDRLETFFDTHPNAQIKVVLIQHTVNDATDNYQSIGYHLGIWETKNRSKGRSRLHLLNFIGYTVHIISQSGSTPENVPVNHPYVQDLLWAYERQGRVIDYPLRVTIRDRWIEFDMSTVKNDMSVEQLIERKKLSRVQRDLMFESLNCLHETCAEKNVMVVHIFLSTTPDWYMQELLTLVRDSAEFRKCPAVFAGRIPETDEYSGPIMNTHSGGHFNGEYNRLWAERVAGFLREIGVY
jgi:hypothetical protein